jgi:hypothetical protein
VLRQIQGKFLDACSIHDYIPRKVVKMQLDAVYIARNWFAGHGSCTHNDISGALMALEKILETISRMPTCSPQLREGLDLTHRAVCQLLQRLASPPGMLHVSFNQNV